MGPPKSKKRKTSHDLNAEPATNNVDTSKPTAVFTPTSGRNSTLSVALPGSIIANAQSHDQKTFLAGSIARALAVFCVDEIIIFDDEPTKSPKPNNKKPQAQSQTQENDDDAYTAYSSPSHFLTHLLSFLETPPYLRKHLFPMHKNLRTAGTLPSLDMPHHLRANEWLQYREGVSVSDTDGYGGNSTVVDTGLPHKVVLKGAQIPPGTRLTIKYPEHGNIDTAEGAEPVAPSAPREEAGYYWGYTVRRCAALSSVFTESPFDGGYDVSFGTSERGVSLSNLMRGRAMSGSTPLEPPPRCQHLLLVFGGVAGLEKAVAGDPELKTTFGIQPSEAEKLFDYWVNLCPNQGSRTIRTEEAVWLGLMGLRDYVMWNGESREEEEDE